jgi:hypothetical protein
MVAMTLHAANRMLEREIPFAAIEACRRIAPILNENPLRFRCGELTIIATKKSDITRIISVWKSGQED